MLQKTLSRFLDDLYRSYKDNKKRDLISDLEQFLHLKNIKYHVTQETQTVAKIPTIIISNHFVRPLLLRRSFLTTLESAITSAIITTAATKLLGKKITWVVKDDLAENIFFLSLKMRKIQLASIYCYDQIGVSENYPFGNFEKWASYLKNGYSIEAYPEAVVSQQMQKCVKGFTDLLNHLNKAQIEYQLLPVSIYWQNGSFKASFSKPLSKSKNTSRLVSLAMVKIAANLPIQFQGVYKKEVEELKARLQQQQANGLKQELLVPEAISA